jgi:hypothetical protein
MTENAAAAGATAAPTSENPQVGVIAVQIGEHQVPISSVCYWVEDDGTHVFRSSEFDCQAEAQDEWGAVQKFVDNAEDLFRFLDDVVDAGRATDGEKVTLIKLSRRFFEIYEASQLEEEAKSNHRVRNLLRLLRQPPRRNV